MATLAERAYEASAGGEACARVLLSANDAWQWGFTAGDLARMEPRYLEAALIVLRGRAYLGPPPTGAAAAETTQAAYFEALARHWRPGTIKPGAGSGGYP